MVKVEGVIWNRSLQLIVNAISVAPTKGRAVDVYAVYDIHQSYLFFHATKNTLLNFLAWMSRKFVIDIKELPISHSVTCR